jgi:hypothetical protein
MKLQRYFYVALAAHQSAALTLPRVTDILERRQTESGGNSLVDTLGSILTGLLGGSQSVSGMLSGFSIASMYVTAVNCKSYVSQISQSGN